MRRRLIRIMRRAANSMLFRANYWKDPETQLVWSLMIVTILFWIYFARNYPTF